MRHRSALTRFVLVACATSWTACTGDMLTPLGPDHTGSESGGSGGAQGLPSEVAAALVPLTTSGARRLTRSEYTATIHSLLGEDIPVDATLLPIDGSIPFDNFASEQVASAALIEAVEAQADVLAQAAVADATHRSRIVSCRPSGAEDDACFRTFLNEFGRRVFRRPLNEQQVQSFAEFATISREDNDFYAGVRYAISAFLSHPLFLYRIEGAGEEERALDDYEIATRLAFFLTGQTPDDALLESASAGLLNDDARLRAEAERLLDTPAAKAHIQRFFAMWLGYDNFALDGLFGAMRRESDALVARVSYGDLDFSELFTARETLLDGELAAHYGLSTNVSSAAWTTLPDPERAGILGHASVLTATSNTNDTSPTRRGKFIRERLLCSKVPPPPPGVDSDAPPVGSTKSACKDERYAAHATRPECAGCHRLMDPIGFGLEQFDRLGRRRRHDDGRAECTIEGAGELVGLAPFRGAAELGELVVASDAFETCVSQQVLSFALGKSLEEPEVRERSAIRALGSAFESGGRRFRNFLLDLVTSQTFRARREVSTP